MMRPLPALALLLLALAPLPARAALTALPAGARIVVAELVTEIVTWARGPLAHLFDGCLADPRVKVRVKDVHSLICAPDAAFDAILLDVDNGPDGLIHLANERLYCNWGLRAAYTALRPGGILGIWSAYPDKAFGDRLENAGFEVDEIRVGANRGGKGPRHTIWMATRAG